MLSTVNDNHKEKKRNSLFSRFNTMGRLKKYFIHSFETKDGKFINTSRLVNKRNDKLSDLIRDAKKYGYEHVDLPLPVTKFSRPVGVVKDDMYVSRFVNNKKAGPFEKDSVVVDYLNIKNPDMLDELMSSNTGIFGGDWKYAQQNVINMCLNPRPENFRISDLINGYFSRSDIDLVLPKLSKYDPEYIFGLPINPKAKSGHLTNILLFAKRKLSTTWTKEAAVFYTKEIMANPDYTLDKSLTAIGGREKRNDINLSSNKKYRTRVINNPEDIPTMISQSVIKPINEHIQKINDGFNYGGRINGTRNYMRLEDELRCDIDMVNINPDVSEHDGSVKEDNAIVAMSFLRCCYPESEEIDKLFIYIFSSIIFRRFVLPESGLVYEITKGLSTGHGFTSIMTTLIAYGSIATSINLTHSDKDIKRTRIINAGDDITAKVVTRHLTSMYNVLLTRSGFLFDDIRDYSGYFSSKSPILQCTFLKKKYGEYMLSWNDTELFKNLLQPTMKTKGFGSKLDNLKQMIYQAPFDDMLNNAIKTIYIMQMLSNYSISGRNKDIKYISDNLFNYNLFLHKIKQVGDLNINPMVYLNDGLKFRNVLYYNSAMGAYLYMDINVLIKEHIKLIDSDLTAKRIWFNKYILFERHRKTMRLAIFDIGKLNTKPQGYYYTKYKNCRWE